MWWYKMHKEIKLYDTSDVIEFSLCNVQVSVNFTVFIGKSTISRPFQVLDMTCSIQVEHLFSWRLLLGKTTYDERCPKSWPFVQVH